MGPKGSGDTGRWSPKRGEVGAALRAHLERYGGLAVALAPFLPIPSSFVYAAAGWTGMSFRRFMVFDVVGMLAWIALIVGLGYAVGHPAVQLAKAISHYALLITLAAAAILIAVGVLRTRRAAAKATARSAPERTEL